MYPHPGAAGSGSSSAVPPRLGPASQKKVDVVCDALRVAMETMDPNKSVMLIYAKQMNKFEKKSNVYLNTISL